ncbi:hypothetical protein COO60DRAFT_393581 [Scenedesmus sp. NREL 46B-D3]|nr:hypothetical protein COO60DRAFT_393581 [Scenedesmus sp. NREL 46B-D3]
MMRHLLSMHCCQRSRIKMLCHCSFHAASKVVPPPGLSSQSCCRQSCCQSCFQRIYGFATPAPDCALPVDIFQRRILGQLLVCMPCCCCLCLATPWLPQLHAAASCSPSHCPSPLGSCPQLATMTSYAVSPLRLPQPSTAFTTSKPSTTCSIYSLVSLRAHIYNTGLVLSHNAPQAADVRNGVTLCQCSSLLPRSSTTAHSDAA